MYKFVETLEEEAVFIQIWTQAWLEKGFELEFAEQVLGQCLVFDESNVPIATVEMKPYTLHNSELDKLAPFASHPMIASYPEHVAEVDKVAVLKDHRGKNLERLLATIVLFAETNQIKNYVTLLEPILFRALKISFHVPMSRVGENFFYKGDVVVPAIIHAEQFYKNKENYAWFMEAVSSKAQNNLVHTNT
ncbi:hypothetical protein D3C78_644630 [compost metagenome]